MKFTKIGAQAAALYLSGLSIEDVAAELNVCYRTARKAILRNGVSLRDPSARLMGRTRPDKADGQRREQRTQRHQLVECSWAPTHAQAKGEQWS